MKVAFKFTKDEVEAEMVAKAESIVSTLYVAKINWGSYGSCEIEIIMTDEPIAVNPVSAAENAA